MFRGNARDSSLLPLDFTLDPLLCFTRLACHVYHISRHNIHIKWILLRVILHASWNMRFSIHQHSWVKPLLHRRLSLSLRPWKIATLQCTQTSLIFIKHVVFTDLFLRQKFTVSTTNHRQIVDGSRVPLDNWNSLCY